MKIQVKDDFDLEKIIYSGQCFRPVQKDGVFRFITGENILFAREISRAKNSVTLEVSCPENEWDEIWRPYFDLDRNYGKLRRLAENDSFLKNAADFGRGIRILRQDPWEMLISYIISQRKSIPAIRTSIERICSCCGNRVTTELDNTQCVNASPASKSTQCVRSFNDFYIPEELRKIHLFPSPVQLLTAEGLEDCGLGYRLPYIKEAARMAADGEINPDALILLSNDELFAKLNTIKGVGTKVANCVMLFGYSRTDRAPVDVWIKRIIDNEYGGNDPFPTFGDAAGIMQQYAFNYMVSRAHSS